MIRRDSYLKIGAEVAVMLGAMAALAAFGLKPPAKPEVVVEAPPPTPKQEATPAAPIVPAAARTILDDRAIAKAEGDLEAAARRAESAEARTAEADAQLKAGRLKAIAAEVAHRSAAESRRGPSPKLEAIKASGGVLLAERDKLRGEIEALNDAPKPRRKILADKSPVAKKAEGEEFHFEIRGDRVAFIDLERLLDRVKTDARVQIRLTNGTRPAVGTVGPIGAFEMHYEVGRIDDGSNARVGNFGLSAWEITASRGSRGETYSDAMGPASDFARAVRRLNPTRDVITLWVYPDGFPMYRKLRETLHAQGFLVAARPLPEGLTIRGSPSGSASSAQ